MSRNSTICSKMNKLFGVAGYTVTKGIIPLAHLAELSECLVGLGPGAHQRLEEKNDRYRSIILLCAQYIKNSICFSRKALYLEGSIVLIKQANGSEAVPPHQDGISDDLRLDPQKSASAWIPLQDTDQGNGTLIILPGSHRTGYLEPERMPPDGNSQSPLAIQLAPSTIVKGETIAVKASSVCLFDSRLIHWSGPNNSSRLRYAVNMRLVFEEGIRYRQSGLPPLYRIS